MGNNATDPKELHARLAVVAAAQLSVLANESKLYRAAFLKACKAYVALRAPSPQPNLADQLNKSVQLATVGRAEERRKAVKFLRARAAGHAENARNPNWGEDARAEEDALRIELLFCASIIEKVEH